MSIVDDFQNLLDIFQEERKFRKPLSSRSLSGRFAFSTFVGPPLPHVYPAGSLVRKTWSLVVPVQSSE